MKSVGEVMAIGRNFEEVIQKGLRMIGQGMHGFVANKEFEVDDIDAALTHPTDKRIFVIAHALKNGYTVERIHELTKIDRWFLDKLENIIRIENELEQHNNITHVPDELLLEAKQRGFSDFQLARTVAKSTAKSIDADMLAIRSYRKMRGITPYVKQIDTLAAEYPAMTNYLYVTYSASAHDIDFPHDNRSVIVLGSGAYRIGSSVEFDSVQRQRAEHDPPAGTSLGDDQLQSRDGLDRLRHLRPALLRRADARAGAGHHRSGDSARRDRLDRRTDTQ